MRKILFRAKLHDNSKWIEGTFTYEEGKRPVIDVLEYDETYKEDVVTSWVIIPETLGQFTGLTDKNGVKIFEGDILVSDEYPYTSDGKQNYFAEVVWFDNVPAFGLYTFKAPKSAVRGIAVGSDYIEDFNSSEWEVIGNIHDNPELLKESAT